MHLGIIVGHTNAAKGASMATPYAFVQEYEFNTLLAALLASLLKRRGIACSVHFRDEGGISGAYEEAFKSGALACIELHFNSFSGAAQGTETLYGSHKMSGYFAKCVHQSLCEFFRRNGMSRGIRQLKEGERGFSNVNAIDLPIILIEPFFGSDVGEAEFALMYFTELADSIMDGILTWIGEDASVQNH